MRVLFVPFFLATHYLHQVPLAWALRTAGHDVRVATAQPPVTDAVLTSGLTAVRVGGDYDVLGRMSEATRGLPTEPLPPGEFRRRNADGLKEYAAALLRITDDLLEYAQWWRPHLIVADPLVSVAPIVSERLGVPLVRLLFGPDILRKMNFPVSGAPVDGDPREAWPKPLVALYDAKGVEVRADYAVRTIDTCPESVQLPGTPHRTPMRYVPYNGPGQVPGWLREPAGRPRVCVTWGTVNWSLRGLDASPLPGILEALTSLDVEVVAALSAADREALGTPPDGVRVAQQLPLHLVLPTCDAILHHGGGGATLTAIAHGVPQVASGQSADQALNAERVAAAGGGLALPAADLGPDAVKAAVSRVLTEAEPRAGAARLRAENDAQPSPAAVARALEELI